MPAKKIVSDVYTIRAPEVIIDGNLIVGGSQTSQTVQNTSIQDKTIVLNDGEIGPGITGADKFSGIEIDRGSSSSVGIRFNENPAGDNSVPPSWQATEDGTTWRYLLQGTSGSTGLNAVVDDTAPELGGNLNITGYTIYNTSANVVFYASSVGGGGTGIYVDNSQGTEQELVSKRKAIVYSLIF